MLTYIYYPYRCSHFYSCIYILFILQRIDICTPLLTYTYNPNIRPFAYMHSDIHVYAFCNTGSSSLSRKSLLNQKMEYTWKTYLTCPDLTQKNQAMKLVKAIVFSLLALWLN